MAAEDYIDLLGQDEYEINYGDMQFSENILSFNDLALKCKQNRKNKMAKRKSKVYKGEELPTQNKLFKPRLIKVGKHLIDPNDVAAIVKAGDKKGLFIIRQKSQPNPDYPLWVFENELGALLNEFEIIEKE